MSRDKIKYEVRRGYVPPVPGGNHECWEVWRKGSIWSAPRIVDTFLSKDLADGACSMLNSGKR